MLQPSDHFCGPPLDLVQQVHVLLVLRAPELDAGLQVGSHQLVRLHSQVTTSDTVKAIKIADKNEKL